jgi:hypothetical protein
MKKLLSDRFLLHHGQKMVENGLNKTSQAYPAACGREAQTGGLLYLHGPAMPLNDAHFGGCFFMAGLI